MEGVTDDDHRALTYTLATFLQHTFLTQMSLSLSYPSTYPHNYIWLFFMSTYVHVVSINMWENLISEMTCSWKLIVDHHLITEYMPHQQCTLPATCTLTYGGHIHTLHVTHMHIRWPASFTSIDLIYPHSDLTNAPLIFKSMELPFLCPQACLPLFLWLHARPRSRNIGHCLMLSQR